jgi:hypothetical protein
MTMKIFLKNLWFEVWNFLCYLASIFTNKAVVVSAGFIIGGLIGWSLSGAFRIVLFAFFGAITIPYTTLPIAISSAAVLGGTISFFIAQAIAANRWFENKKVLVVEEVSVTASVIESKNLAPLAFNPEAGILSFHGKTCEIPFKTYQHALCAKLFERPGTRIDEKDIMREIDWEMDKADSDRLVKDAVYAVNRKAKAELGIKNILVWKKFTAWVSDEYASDFLGG